MLDKIESLESVAERFNKFLLIAGPNLATKIPQSGGSFKSCLPKVNATLNKTRLTEDEFKKTFKSNRNKLNFYLTTNKSSC